MTEVIVACEGRTEEAFVNQIVEPLLSPRAIYVQPRLIPTSAHAKGGARSPEHINDGAETHPSARLLQRLHGYKKVSHGVGVAACVGIERIRAECRHFDAWFARIEALAPLRREP